MRFAVISDVQGNLDAVRAVLDDLDRYPRRIDRIISAGDAIGLGPQPNEVLDLFHERDIESIRGNYDDAIAFERIGSGVDFPDAASEEADRLAIIWTRDSLTQENLEYLRGLPQDLRLFQSAAGTEVKRDSEDPLLAEHRRTFFARLLFGGLASRPPRQTSKRVMIVHGSPRALNEFVRPDTANSILANIAQTAQADVLVSGHAGIGFERVLQGTTFVGVGSVSGPYASPGEAQYAVVDVAQEVEADFGHVTYDPSDYLHAIVDSGLPSRLAQPFRLHSL
jgi:predicted phosphodiesterase